MKAVLDEHILADSDDTITRGGYVYFPPTSVRIDRLEKAARTTSDLECPHGVQFYDAIVDGKRHSRAAWVYETPRPAMADVAGRFGFWNDVKVM